MSSASPLKNWLLKLFKKKQNVLKHKNECKRDKEVRMHNKHDRLLLLFSQE